MPGGSLGHLHSGVQVARLRAVGTRLALQPMRLAPPMTEAERFRLRDETRPSRKWMKTARWRKLRWQVLTEALFRCERPGCGRSEVDTSQLVADHREPHRDDPVLFWDRANLWCLCKRCHDQWKQAEERRVGR